MDSFNAILSKRLEDLRQRNLFRRLRSIDSPQQTHIQLHGRSLLNFSSNDYLGLANAPELKAAAAQGIAQNGVGSGASRLVSGSLAPHHQLEATLADFKGTEAALVFSTGYATALGTIPALVARGDIIVIDKLVHASIVDAARLSGAQLRVFAHNDLDDLRSILEWTARERLSAPDKQVLIVTESIFSMDGDAAPLDLIVDLKEKYRAWLMVDEAHATGLFGPNRRGLAEQFGVTPQIEIQMGTLGKAIGASGGFIAGSQVLVEYLVNRARSFVFSTGPAPAVSAAARAAIDLIRGQQGAERLAKLRARIAQFSHALQIPTPFPDSPIFPLIIGPEQEALEFADELLATGFFVPAIRYPTVARGKARLRFTFSATHTQEEVATLAAEVLKFRAKKNSAS